MRISVDLEVNLNCHSYLQTSEREVLGREGQGGQEPGDMKLGQGERVRAGRNESAQLRERKVVNGSV